MDLTGPILGVLTLIENLLPLLGGATGNVALVGSIIGALVKLVPLLEKITPLLGDEATLVWTGVKNIINNLKGDGVVTTAQQDADLDALDARVDASWDKIAPQFDPDAGIAGAQ